MRKARDRIRCNLDSKGTQAKRSHSDTHGARRWIQEVVLGCGAGAGGRVCSTTRPSPPPFLSDDDFDFLCSTTTAFDARREMLDQALERADAVLGADRVLSGNAFKDGDEFVALPQARD